MSVAAERYVGGYWHEIVEGEDGRRLASCRHFHHTAEKAMQCAGMMERRLIALDLDLLPATPEGPDE